jgi:NmrA-like family
VTPEALNVQFPLADAAKKAGVKLFVPSEFGNPTEGKTGGMWSIKDAVKKYLVKIDLPYAQFFNGAFIDWFLVNHPEHGAFDWPRDKVVIKGTGNTPISWTTQTDVARYVVYVLTKLAPDLLRNATFAIEGERKTLNEIVEDYQAHTGKKLDISYESREFLEKAVKEHPDDWDNGRIRLLYLVLDKGEAITGTPGEVNKYWSDFYPTKVVDAILARWGSGY